MCKVDDPLHTGGSIAMPQHNLQEAREVTNGIRMRYPYLNRCITAVATRL